MDAKRAYKKINNQRCVKPSPEHALNKLPGATGYPVKMVPLQSLFSTIWVGYQAGLFLEFSALPPECLRELSGIFPRQQRINRGGFLDSFRAC